MSISSTNPATGKLIQSFTPLTDSELETRLARASAAFRQHRQTSFADRAQKMMRAADILEKEKDAFGRLMTLEMGKTLKSAVEEVVKSAWGCRYYAETAAKWLADEPAPSGAPQSFIRYLPIGPVLAIMPWNFPFWQVFRFAAPALMAGNVGLLKHASSVPQCAIAIEDVFARAGFSDGVFQTLLVDVDVAPRLIDDPRIAAVTLTGSEPAGRLVAAQAGKQIKKTVLELGGSDPFIVMPSADLDAAVKTAVKARIVNNGQSCIAAKRFIVADAIYDRFEKEFVQGMAAVKVGDPMDPSTEVGPLATEKLLKDLDSQVQALVGSGARVLTGGKRLDRPGNYYETTVLTDIRPDAPGFYEELFGPVAMLFRVADIDAAVRLANDSPFGLGASAWTSDASEQQRFASELDAGMVFINQMVASDPRLPFGGIKHSGYGRELGGFGIREFTNIKTVCIYK